MARHRLTLQEALLTSDVRDMLRGLIREDLAALGGGRLQESAAPSEEESAFEKRCRFHGIDPAKFGFGVAPGGRDDRRLREAPAPTVEPPRAVSAFARLARSRGLDPAVWGMPDGDAA